MALEATYNKVQDVKEGGRRKTLNRETMRECGLRVGVFEMGYRAKTDTHWVDEKRRDVAGKVDRVFRIGFTKEEPEYTPMAA